MELSQDEAKIIIQILSALRYTPSDGKDIFNILEKLDKFVIDKNLNVPTISFLPENMNIKIDRKIKVI